MLSIRYRVARLERSNDTQSPPGCATTFIQPHRRKPRVRSDPCQTSCLLGLLAGRTQNRLSCIRIGCCQNLRLLFLRLLRFLVAALIIALTHLMISLRCGEACTKCAASRRSHRRAQLPAGSYTRPAPLRRTAIRQIGHSLDHIRSKDTFQKL